MGSLDVSQAILWDSRWIRGPQACAGMVNAIAFETSETLVSHVTGAVSKVGTENRGTMEVADVTAIVSQGCVCQPGKNMMSTFADSII